MSRSILAYFVPTEHRRINEFIGLLLATTAILVGLSLVSFNPTDPSFNISRGAQFDAKPAYFIGVFGSYLADAFFQTFGYASFLLPIFLGIYAFYWLASWKMRALGFRLSGMILMGLTLAAALSLSPALPRVGGAVPPGGFLGKIMADRLDNWFNPAGSAVVLLALFMVSLFLSTTFSFAWAVETLKPRFGFVSRWSERYRTWQDERKQDRERRRTEERKAPKRQIIVSPKEAAPPVADPEPKPVTLPRQKAAPQPPPIAPRTVSAPVRPVPAGPTDLPSSSLLVAAMALGKIDEEELRERALQIEKNRNFEAAPGSCDRCSHDVA